MDVIMGIFLVIGSESSADAAVVRALKFKPKKVTDEMVRPILILLVHTDT